MQNKRYCFIQIVMQWQIRKILSTFFSQWESGQSTDIAFRFSTCYSRSGKAAAGYNTPAFKTITTAKYKKKSVKAKEGSLQWIAENI